MNFGINLSFAIKRWPEAPAWAKLVRETLGLDLVQFTYDLLDPWWPDAVRRPMAAEVRKAARDYGIRIDSAFSGLIRQSAVMKYPVGLNASGSVPPASEVNVACVSSSKCTTPVAQCRAVQSLGCAALAAPSTTPWGRGSCPAHHTFPLSASVHRMSLVPVQDRVTPIDVPT